MQLDVVGKVGISRVQGYSAGTDGTPFIDSGSHAPVTFTQTNATAGLNLVPWGLDAGAFVGRSESEIIWP